MKMCEKGTTHILGGTESDIARFHRATQNGAQFKHEFFIYELFHLIFLDHGELRVVETKKSRTAGKEGYCTGIWNFSPSILSLSVAPATLIYLAALGEPREGCQVGVLVAQCF